MNTAQVIPFQFDTREVRTMLIDDQPWFVAADVAAALGYQAAPQMTRNLDEDERGMQNVHTPSRNQHGAFGTVEQEMLVINESGLYSAILRSRKAEAKRFKKWITAEVLPAIRRTGQYHDSSNKMATLIGETIGTNGFNMLGSLIKGKVAALPAALQRKATAKIWSQTHAAFGVRSAADIPASQLDAARNFVAAYALEGEWLPHEVETAAVELDAYGAQYVYLLLTAIHGMQKDRERLGEAARQLESSALMRVYDHLLESRSAFSYLDKKVGLQCYQAWRGLGAADGGYLMGCAERELLARQGGGFRAQG